MIVRFELDASTGANYLQYDGVLIKSSLFISECMVVKIYSTLFTVL